MNDTATSGQARQKLTQRRSRSVHFELVSYREEIFGPYATLEEAGQAAASKWPDQQQDEDRTGAGWDIQVVGLT